MAPHYPLYIRRSDGQLETRSSKTNRESNEPLPEQLNQKPNAQGVCDFYRQCALGDTKEEDWRRKLAGMLIREIGNDLTRDKNYILASLPQNYRLFEHVKFKVSADPNNPPKDKSSKNHAGGSNDRQDAYLYGHPLGRKKRYRSPAEFFPHLLWLATDQSGDPNNCACKFCSPEELEEDKTKAPPSTAVTAAGNALPASSSSKAQVKLTAPVTAPKARPQPLSRAGSNLPSFSELPPFRSKEQKLDAQYNNFIFRNGELVWFERRQGAWGLGVIIKRDNGGPGKRHQYHVQPLSNPLQPQKLETVVHEQMRPWLAWSPPLCTNPGLNASPANGNKEYTFSTTPWPQVLQRQFAGPNGEGDAVIDGSVLAAKQVETTFTPFGPLARTETQPQNEAHYNGIYIGGEKIWLGDALRLRQGSTLQDILVLLGIREVQNPKDANKPELLLVGDVYTPRTVELESQPVPDTDLHLPLRVREDLYARNKVTSQGPVPQRRHHTFWKLLVKGSRNHIGDIKGRVYETSVLRHLLDPPGYKDACAKGEWSDVGGFMNGQGDCNKSAILGAARAPFQPADQKTDNREAAFGPSVPAGCRVSRGLDEPSSGSNGLAPRPPQLENAQANNSYPLLSNQRQQPQSQTNQPLAPQPQQLQHSQYSQRQQQHLAPMPDASHANLGSQGYPQYSQQHQFINSHSRTPTPQQQQQSAHLQYQQQPSHPQQLHQQQQMQHHQPQQQQQQQQYSTSHFDEEFIHYEHDAAAGYNGQQNFGHGSTSEYPQQNFWMDGP